MHQQCAEMAGFDIGVGCFSCADAIYEILLMWCIGKAAIHLVADNRMTIFWTNIDLPPRTHTAHNHHRLAAVDLHAFSVLRPVWKHVTVADPVISLEHVRRIERHFEGHHQVVEFEH